MKILISGFEAFGGNPVNASQEVVRTLERIPMPGIRLETIILPVDRTRCANELLARAQQSQTQAVL